MILKSVVYGEIGTRAIVNLGDGDRNYKVVFMRGEAVEVSRMMAAGWRAVWGEWQRRKPGATVTKVIDHARALLARYTAPETPGEPK